MVAQQDFRQAMATLAAAVNVITTDGPAGRHGMTATAVCSVSDDPASLLLCVNRTARMHDVLRENGRFCVNVLAAGQENVSGAFATRDLSMADRLAAAGAVVELGSGLPALVEAQVAMGCRVVQMIAAGTHTIFIGEVDQIVAGSGEGALTYYGRNYHNIGQSCLA